MTSPTEALRGVEAFVFDVFGTTVNWYGNMTRTLAEYAQGTQEGVWQELYLRFVKD